MLYAINNSTHFGNITTTACIAGSGIYYNLDIEWRAAELLRSLPNKSVLLRVQPTMINLF